MGPGLKWRKFGKLELLILNLLDTGFGDGLRFSLVLVKESHKSEWSSSRVRMTIVGFC